MDWIGPEVRCSCQHSVENSRDALQKLQATMRRVCEIECLDSVDDHQHARSLQIVESIEATCSSEMEPVECSLLGSRVRENCWFYAVMVVAY